MNVWQATGSNGSQVGSGRALVVPREDPDLAVPLHPHLRRPQDMPRRMERDRHLPDPHRLAERHPLDHRRLPQPPPEDRHRSRRPQVRPAPPPRMIPMPMGDHRPLDRLPGIDVEPPGLAEQAAVVGAEEGGAHPRRTTRLPEEASAPALAGTCGIESIRVDGTGDVPQPWPASITPAERGQIGRIGRLRGASVSGPGTPARCRSPG